ncbi:MAG TPA: hypothetical protein VGK73_07565, partial [Polyangiaceae bacterium]
GGVNVNNWRMTASTNSCKQNPNDTCCRPCIVGPAPGCGDNAAEGCPENGYLSIADDSMNQRCYNQVQRFGINLLYPTSRYVDAITKRSIDPRMDGRSTPNPLFAPGPLGEPGRDPGLVLLAGIVGVPWQDIASDGNVPVPDDTPQPLNSLVDPRALVYLSAGQLRSMGRWDVILGEPSGDPPIAPLDPLMIESIDPRPAGLPHPLGYPGGDIVLPGGNAVNAINGREQAVAPATRDDLQFACIFPLENAMPCDATNTAGCDCNVDEYVKDSPLCDYRNGSTSDGVQINAKAYPSVRELEVLRGVEDAGIVASICPKNVTAQGAESQDPYFGYNPAVSAIVGRMKEALTTRCLPRALDPVTWEDVELGSAEPEDLGSVPCVVVEVRPAGGGCVSCDSPGRAALAGDRSKVVPAVKDYLSNQGQCGEAPLPSCDNYCMCEIEQLAGDDLFACKTEGLVPGLRGYCYVDPAVDQASAEVDGRVTPEEQWVIDASSDLVASCPATERRVLRFLGDNLPDRGALTTIVCPSASAND